MRPDQPLRDQLVALLGGGNAHLGFDAAVAGVPPEYRGRRADAVPRTLWQLVEHMRICQWDLLEYSRNPGHTSPPFPDGYWPNSDGPPDPAAWDDSLARFHADLQSMQDLVADPATDLLATLPGTPGHNVLREALILADHNAYHLGQIVTLRRVLGIWPE